MWTGPDERGRLARSLLTFVQQLDAIAPDRDKDYDESIGDKAHQARESDHNASHGIVHAIDITHDPAHGVDAQQIADQIRASRDPRVKYLIHAGRISNPDFNNWAWRERNKGPDDHAHHLHMSVKDELEDDTRPWQIKLTDKSSTPTRRALLKVGSTGNQVVQLQTLLGIPVDGVFGNDTLAAVKAFQMDTKLELDGVVGSQTWSRLYQAKTPPRLSTDIKATVFNDGVIPGTGLAYSDVKDPAAPGLALPAPFPGKRPIVWARNRSNDLVAVLPIIDKGPHYDGAQRGAADRYWETSSRPRAESDTKTNGAGIDLNLAAADLLGVTYELDGSGRVKAGGAQLDWGFMPEGMPVPQPQPDPKPDPKPDPLPQPTDLAAAIAALNAATVEANALTVALRDAIARLERLATSSSSSSVPATRPPAPSTSVQVLDPLRVAEPLKDLVPVLSGVLVKLGAVNPALQGAGIALTVLTELLDQARQRQP